MTDTLFKAPANLGELVAEAKPKLEETIAEADIARRSITRDRVIELTATLLANWPSIREPFHADYKPERVQEIEGKASDLAGRAWVFHATDLAAEELGADPHKKQVDALSAKVAGWDYDLFELARGPFRNDPEARAILESIARGRGRRDDIEDTQRLVSLFRNNWANVGNTEVTLAMLDEAEADANKLIELLESKPVDPARLLAERAYTAWQRDYKALLKIGRFYAEDDPDVLARFPGVRPETAPRSTSSKPSEAPAETPAADAPSEASDPE